MTDEQKSEITGLWAAGAGYTVIARRMGLPRDTVRSFCRRNGLAGETAGGKEGAAGCGQPFTAYGNAGRKYCSHGCYIRARFKGGGGDE